MSVVSVIIPCYNYAHFLPACVESVLNQSITVKVLIIDDCSTDNTPDVGAGLSARDRRVQYRRHSVNAGHIATYNEGLQWADGDYTVLLSADDLLTAGSLMRAASLLDSNPDVGFVYGAAIKFDTGQQLPQANVVDKDNKYNIQSGHDWIKSRCADGGNCIYSPEVMVRTAIQKRVGGYRKELPHSGDLEMWMRFAAYGDVGILESEQAYYRIHSQNMHVRQYSEQLVDLKERKSAFDSVFEQCRDRIHDRESLQQLYLSSLSKEAIWAVCEAFDRSETSSFSSSDFLKFAVEIYPDSRMLSEYSSLRRRMLLGGRAWSLLRRLSGKDKKTLAYS